MFLSSAQDVGAVFCMGLFKICARKESENVAISVTSHGEAPNLRKKCLKRALANMVKRADLRSAMHLPSVREGSLNNTSLGNHTLGDCACIF